METRQISFHLLSKGAIPDTATRLARPQTFSKRGPGRILTFHLSSPQHSKPGEHPLRADSAKHMSSECQFIYLKALTGPGLYVICYCVRKADLC